MAKELNKSNYVTILGWMVQDLHLKGSELLVYALIHGFCQDGESKFTGSVAFIQAWTGLSYQGVANVLKSLVQKGLLEKTSNIVNGVTFCHYRSVDPPKKVGTPSQKSWDNNTTHNNTPNGDNISIPPTPTKFDFREALLGLGVEPKVADSWLLVRKNKRATNTEIAFDAIAKEIAKSGMPANECIRIAVVKSWCGFKASWLEEDKGTKKSAASPKPDKFERMMAVGSELFYQPQNPVCDEQ